MDLSAIDYAIYYKYPEAALAMVTHEERANEIMALKSDKHPCVTLALIASMPKVFEAVQDKCITKANCKKDSKSFYVCMQHSGDVCDTECTVHQHITLKHIKTLHQRTQQHDNTF